MKLSIFRKLAAIFLTLILMAAAVVPAYADEVLEGAAETEEVGMVVPGYTDPRTSGQCGDNINFQFSDETGVVSVTGTGATWDYSPTLTNIFTPLNYLDGTLYMIEIGSGITEIKSGFIPESYTLSTIMIPTSVKKIGSWNLRSANNAEYILYEGTEAEWNQIDIEDGNYPECSAILFKDQWNAKATGRTDPRISGKCGDHMYFNFSDDTGVVKVIGAGSTWDYNPSLNVYTQLNYLDGTLYTIEFVQGVKEIKDGFIPECETLTNVVLPQTVETIGTFNFHTSNNITYILYEGTEADWNNVTVKEGNYFEAATVRCKDKWFSDVKEGKKYYFNPVYWAVDDDITTGYGEGTFQPDVTCSRAMIVTFLYRFAGSPKVTGTENFSDVKPGDWFYDAVVWAVENGITTGYGEGTFQPKEKCSRAMIVTFIKRCWAKDVPVEYKAVFPDIPEGEWYTDAVLWASECGITTGIGGYFKPFNPCTRGQAVTFLNRLYKMVSPQ